MGEPEDMAGLHVYDDHRILMPIMELEFIDAEESGLPLGLNESLPVDSILLFQPLQVNLLYGVLAKAGDVRHLLVGEAIGEQVPGIAQQFAADAMPLGLERDILHVAVSTSRTVIA